MEKKDSDVKVSYIFNFWALKSNNNEIGSEAVRCNIVNVLIDGSWK